MFKTNSNIESFIELLTPDMLSNNLPIKEDISTFITNSREIIASIIKGEDRRKLLIVGPCSIHNVDEAYEYAKLLKTKVEDCKDKLFIVMRVYFEKPRTNVGWKGLINDPNLDGTHDITRGLHLSRELLIKIANLKIPVATEFLDTFTPQYIGDLISWGSIGARTVESQVHRQLASGLSIPIGFKNSTSGSISAALNSMKAAASPQTFYGINMDGNSCMIKTKGNDNTHIILRGSDNGPNYYLENVKEIPDNVKILIDCSHGNSNKNHEKQKLVVDYYIKNYINNFKFIGLMLESNIIAGKQSIDTKPLKCGISITDACICWDDTKKIISELYEKL